MGLDDGRSQPYLSLDLEDFKLLQALTEFEGTVEQLAIRSALFAERRFDEETLNGALGRFKDLGLLQQDEREIVSFAGDQFDEVYSRYFAAADGAKLFIWKGEFWEDVRNSFFRLIRNLAEVEPIYMAPSAAFDAKRRLQEALATLIGDGSDSSEALPDTATDLYAPLLDMSGRGSMKLAAIRIFALGSSSTQWVILAGDGDEDFLGNEIMVEFTERGASTGVDVSAEIFEYVVPERRSLIDRVRRLGSPNQLQQFAETHYQIGFDAYRGGDLTRPLEEFGVALLLDPDPRYATSQAHVNLLLGDYDSAIKCSEISRELVLVQNEGLDLTQYAFATYDLAVAMLMKGRAEVSALLLDELQDVLDWTGELDGFLAVPNSTEGGTYELIVTDQDADLGQAITDLRAVCT